MLQLVLLTLVALPAASPNAISAETAFPRVSSVSRLDSNTFEAFPLQKRLQAKWGETADVPEMVSVFPEMYREQVPKNDWQVVFHVNITQTRKNFVQVAIYPAG